MHAKMGKPFGALAAAMIATAGFIGIAGAHDGHDHGGAQHGGVAAKTKRHRFEAVFTNKGATLFVYDADHKPVGIAGLSASATFYHPNAPDKPWFTRELKAGQTSTGQGAGSLSVPVDLSSAPDKGVKVAFRVAGLSDPAEPEAVFTVPLAFAGGGAIAVTKAAAADRKAIDQLKVCPVSHEELGSMGTPLKVTRGGRTTYICCKGCLKELEADPDKFLGGPAASAKDAAKHDHEKGGGR